MKLTHISSYLSGLHLYPVRRMFRLGLIISALLGLAYIADAQGGRLAEVSLSLDVDNVFRGSEGRVVIELTNTLDKQDPQKTITISQHYERIDPANIIPVNDTVTRDLKDIIGKAIVFYSNPEKKHSYGLQVVIENPNWPGADSAKITLTSQPGRSVIRIDNLPLQPSQYHITVSRASSHGDDKPFFEDDPKFSAGPNPTLTIRSQTTWETVKAKYANRDSLLLTIIISLIGILATILKDKLKTLVNWFLDLLGKYGLAKLAERRFTRLYLNVVSSEHKYLKVVGFNTTGISRPLLEEVFVSLRIASFGQEHGGAANVLGNNEPAAEQSTVSFATALAQYNQMVILGGPGAGKTTTLSYAVLTFAQKKAKEKFGIQEDLLPIFIPLRRLSNSNRAILEDLLDKDTQILMPDLLKECPPKFFENKLKKGCCIVLLDGLDEVVDERTYRQVAGRINSFVAAYPGNRFLVTCRVAGWKSLLSGEFKILQTQDFNRDEIRRFVLGWHRAVITQSEYTRLQLDNPDKQKFEQEWEKHNEQNVKPAIEARSKSLLRAIDSNNRILLIAVNPMLLSLISLVHFVRHLLPRGRTILYSQCIELLIDAWDRSRDITWHQPNTITPNQKESVLREIAFEFQRKGVGEDSRANLEKFIARANHKLGINMPAPELLEEIELRSGLLIERSIDVFGFSHLTLQEYLVASHIRLNPNFKALMLANFDKQEWREVTLLYAGLLDDATELVAAVAAKPDLERKILAGYCIGDAAHCDEDVSAKVINALLNELDSGRGNSEELVGALAAIAADYDEKAVTVEAKLSETLIKRLESGTLPAVSGNWVAMFGNWIAIVGKARVTKSLPLLISLLWYDDQTIREQAATAIAAFGNAAIPLLWSELDKHSAGKISYQLADSEQSYSDFRRVFQEGVEHQSDGSAAVVVAERAATYLLAIIKIAEEINTSAAAKLLISLYRFQRFEIDVKVSFTLARMLNNPFIEADLQQLDNYEPTLSQVLLSSPDGNGWSYPNLSGQAPFLLLETIIREDLSLLISYPRALMSLKYPEAGQALRTASFKLLFPAIVQKIRDDTVIDYSDLPEDFPTNRKGEQGMAEIIKTFGFSSPEENRLSYLCRQIRKNSSLTVDFALQRGGGESSSTWIKVAAIFGNAIFLALTVVLWWWVGAVGQQAYRPTRSDGKYDPIELAAFVLPILFYVFVALTAHLKLGRKILSLKIFSSVVFAFANFHKILPYLTRKKVWLKFVALHILAFLCSPLAISIIFVVKDIFSGDDTFPIGTMLLLGGFNLVFALISFIYLRFYVLAQNPIYQLILLHPEGKKLLNRR